MTPPPPLPHDKKTLLREVDASIKIRDIRQMDRLRDQVEVKWWESGLILLLFVCALGFLVSAGLWLTARSPQAEAIFLKAVFIWFMPLVFSIILTLEAILRKINALRRLHHLSAQVLESMREDLARLAARPEAPAQPGGETKGNMSE